MIDYGEVDMMWQLVFVAGGWGRGDCVIACVWWKRKKIGIKSLFYLRLGAYVIDPRPIYDGLAAPLQRRARLYLFSPFLPISFSGERPRE